MIPADSIRDDEIETMQGGPYADALIIELDLTRDPVEVLQLYKQEALIEGYDLSAENPIVEGRWLYIWWD